MHTNIDADESGHDPIVSTGVLPDADVVIRLMKEAHSLYGAVTDGAVADYIPALAAADPAFFGLSIVGVRGRSFSVGDHDIHFSIQSVSKPFVFALVCQELGYDRVRELIGVNATGMPFNSVMAVELNPARTMNGLVNAGAIATTGLVPGDTAALKWEFVRHGLSLFAGRDLSMNDEVYQSEAANNRRNLGIAQLLSSYGRLDFDAVAATDVYTRQCSIDVTTEDLAVMAGTLANAGVNPLTGVTVVSPEVCKRVLAVLATAGLYERTGEWLYSIGLPAKSGVSGGIVTVSPGKGGLATYSPPLDDAGNSVRGQLATKFLSDLLGLNLFASRPERPQD